MSYRDELFRELTEVGISGRLRARIVDEFQDHLDCDPQADLGSPGDLAHQFADEIGTTRVRSAAVRAFPVLVVAGAACALVFLLDPQPFFGGHRHLSRFVRVLLMLVALATQVSLATGLLAAARAFRRRRARVVPAAEARIVLRRVVVSLLSALVSVVGVALLAEVGSPRAPRWWVTLAVVSTGIAALGILLVVPTALGAGRVRPTAPGGAGDLTDDLGPLMPPPLRHRPWRVALLLAGAILVLFTVTGFMAADGPDGVARGLADGLACLLGFATVGRYVGLWQPGASPSASGES